MESMEAQIRSERGFIESQMSEREQEREDYEKKINELKQLLTKKSTDLFEAEDAVSNRVSNFYTNYPLFFLSSGFLCYTLQLLLFISSREYI